MTHLHNSSQYVAKNDSVKSVHSSVHEEHIKAGFSQKINRETLSIEGFMLSLKKKVVVFISFSNSDWLQRR